MRSARSSHLAARCAENAVAGIGAFQQFDFETQAQQVFDSMLLSMGDLNARVRGGAVALNLGIVRTDASFQDLGIVRAIRALRAERQS